MSESPESFGHRVGAGNGTENTERAPRLSLGVKGSYTPVVVTGSRRNLLRRLAMEAPHGVYDDGSKARRGSVGVPPTPGVLGKEAASC